MKRAEKKVNELRERAKRRAREEESEKPVILLQKLFTIEEESKQSSEKESKISKESFILSLPNNRQKRYQSRRDFMLGNMQLQSIKEDDNEGVSKSESMFAQREKKIDQDDLLPFEQCDVVESMLREVNLPRFPTFKIDSYLWLSNLELDAIEGEEMDELAEGYQEKSDYDEKKIGRAHV